MRRTYRKLVVAIVASVIAFMIVPLVHGYLEHDEEKRIQESKEELYAGVLARQNIQLTTQALVDALRHPHAVVRAGAVYFLAKSGEQSVVPALRGVLDDKDASVRLDAAEALFRLGDTSGLKAVVQESTNEDAHIRLSAISKIVPFAKIVSDKHQVMSALRRAVKDQDRNVRAAAGIGLGEIGDRSAVVDIKRAIDREVDPAVRSVMEEQLKKLAR